MSKHSYAHYNSFTYLYTCWAPTFYLEFHWLDCEASFEYEYVLVNYSHGP